MQHFNTREWTEVKDRGPVAIIKTPPRDLPDPNVLVGQEVRINLKAYIVKGVETHAISRSEDYPYTLPFGLLVEAKPLPPCLPSKKRYATIFTCHRMLQWLQKKSTHPLEMYECVGHWHIIRVKDETNTTANQA